MNTITKSLMLTAITVFLPGLTFADNPSMQRPATPEQGATDQSVVKPAESPEEKAAEKNEHQLTPEQAAAVAKMLQATKSSPEHVKPELQAAAAKLAQQECSLCHGRGGQSVSPTFPRLAGQRAAYIQEELMEFRDGTRQDPDAEAYMWGMASQLDNDLIEALGHYYENLQPPPAEAEDPKLVSMGKALFEGGDPGAGVPPCQVCHGPQAQGVGPLPRLAGQHVAYLVKQMRSFKEGLRASPVMEPIMRNLTGDQMEDVANYLRTLP